eukprot:UC1_evm2s216
MPVTCVINWPCGKQTVEEVRVALEDRLQRMGAAVTLEAYRASCTLRTGPKRAWLASIALSDTPNWGFFRTEANSVPAVLGTDFNGIVALFDARYPKEARSIVVQGSQWEGVGDFGAVVAPVSVNATIKGLLVIVSYGPATTEVACRPLLQEIVDALAGGPDRIALPPPASVVTTSNDGLAEEEKEEEEEEIFTAQHTAVQYFRALAPYLPRSNNTTDGSRIGSVTR